MDQEEKMSIPADIDKFNIYYTLYSSFSFIIQLFCNIIEW